MNWQDRLWAICLPCGRRQATESYGVSRFLLGWGSTIPEVDRPLQEGSGLPYPAVRVLFGTKRVVR